MKIYEVGTTTSKMIKITHNDGRLIGLYSKGDVRLGISGTYNISVYLDGFQQGSPILVPYRDFLKENGTPYGNTIDDTIANVASILAFNKGGGVAYNKSSPTTVTVGGLLSGTDITGLQLDVILEKILVPFITPTFTSFSISGQTSTIEVGTPLSGNTTFIWSFDYPINIQASSIQIRDVTTNTVIASGLVDDGFEIIDIGVIDNTSPITRQWRAEAIDTQSYPLQSSNFNVNSIYPYFYGVSNTVPSTSVINTGTKVLSNSTGTININFNATNQYIWFAIPSISTSKTKWYVNAINQGNIGTLSDLFNAEISTTADSPNGLWNGINYKLYISNYQTTISSIMQLIN